MKESAIERKLQQEVRKMGGRAFKFVSPGHRGVPDRLVLMPGGRILFVELKTDTGVLSPIQSHTIRIMRELGADVRVVHGMAGLSGLLDGLRAGL